VTSRVGANLIDATIVDAEPATLERYLLLADISGFTRFMAGLEEVHGADFSGGIPAGFGVVGDLLGAVIDGIEPSFAVVKLEGDAVFAAAPARALDGRGLQLVSQLSAAYAVFIARRNAARAVKDHVCTACDAVLGLDLKIVLHRGHTVRQQVGQGTDLLGPAVNLVHRLLKNSVREQLGWRPYLLVTDQAATSLGLAASGVEHREEYSDIGPVGARVIGLERSAGSSLTDADASEKDF